jgi:hypothetical protein
MGLLQIIWKSLPVLIHNLKTNLFGNEMELCVLIVKVYELLDKIVEVCEIGF